MLTQTKTVHVAGTVGCILSTVAYLSFIDQIRLNLEGDKGSWIMPSIMFVACITWILYALKHKPILLPIIICNVPGLVLAPIAAITAIWF